jgi:hypothetical protein
MKEMSFIRKQRLGLLKAMVGQFDPLIQTVTIPGHEKQLVPQPTTPRAAAKGFCS